MALKLKVTVRHLHIILLTRETERSKKIKKLTPTYSTLINLYPGTDKMTVIANNMANVDLPIEEYTKKVLPELPYTAPADPEAT